MKPERDDVTMGPWLWWLGLLASGIAGAVLSAFTPGAIRYIGFSVVVGTLVALLLLDRLGKEWRPRLVREWVVTTAAVLAALGTAAAAISAQIQINDERTAREQSQADQRAGQLRAQADQVSAWPIATDSSGLPISGGVSTPPETKIALSNDSPEPVYQVVVSLVMVQGGGPRTGRDLSQQSNGGGNPYQRTLLLIPPGRSQTLVSGAWPGMGARAGIELAFTDQAGVGWVRYSNGALYRIPVSPIDFYGLQRPVEFATPQTVKP